MLLQFISALTSDQKRRSVLGEKATNWKLGLKENTLYEEPMPLQPHPPHPPLPRQLSWD